MQLRRVLLLFALVLGLSAVVASLAPPPEPADERPEEAPVTSPVATPPPAAAVRTIAIEAPPAGADDEQPATHPAAAGSRIALEVSVPVAGDVAIDELGLRQTADPFDPARFDLLARPPGRYEVTFLPVRGEQRPVARLKFERAATVRQPRPAR